MWRANTPWAPYSEVLGALSLSDQSFASAIGLFVSLHITEVRVSTFFRSFVKGSEDTFDGPLMTLLLVQALMKCVDEPCACHIVQIVMTNEPFEKTSPCLESR